MLLTALKAGEDFYRKIVLKNGPDIADVPLGGLNIPLGAPDYIRFITETKMNTINKLITLRNIILKRKTPYIPYLQYINYEDQLIRDIELQDIMQDLLFSKRAQKRGIFNQNGLSQLWERHFNSRFSFFKELSRVASIELFIRMFIEGEHP